MKLFFCRESKDGEELLDDEKSVPFYFSSRPATQEELNSQWIAEFLDDYEENRNHHDLVGSYAILRNIFLEASNESIAKAVLLALAERGGLCS